MNKELMHVNNFLVSATYLTSIATVYNGPYAKLFFDITHTARLIYKHVRLISRNARVGYFAKAAKIPELCHKIVFF